MPQETNYLWDGPDGIVRVTLVGPVVTLDRHQTSLEMQRNDSVAHPTAPTDLMKVRLAEGPHKGQIRIAFQYELTSEPTKDSGV